MHKLLRPLLLFTQTATSDTSSIRETLFPMNRKPRIAGVMQKTLKKRNVQCPLQKTKANQQQFPQRQETQRM